MGPDIQKGTEMIINGKEEDVATPITVAELVEQRGLRADRVAVELNGEIVPRAQRAQTQLKGTDKETMVLRYSDFAEKASKQSSEREVIAMQIERKAEDCYKAEYARRHLGECYEGRISGVTQRGLFIELENGVEGFVPASSLTATGTMLTEGVRLSDPVSGKNWNLGDTMMITIVRADVNLGKIDFEVAPESAKQ